MNGILSLSYGKDSLACVHACAVLGWKIETAVHCEVWATDTIQADLPKMVEFKEYADRILKRRYGLTVEHIRAPVTYEDCFYQIYRKGKNSGKIWGFPMIRGTWCNSQLKVGALREFEKKYPNSVSYVGIAADEPYRIARAKENQRLPLVELGMIERQCFEWCQENDLLSPIYSDSWRGGCWFCHNQSIDQLRLLRKNYPYLWQLLLQWDKDSPVTFKPNHTVADFEKRFQYEDNRYNLYSKFRWEQLTQFPQMSLF